MQVFAIFKKTLVNKVLHIYEETVSKYKGNAADVFIVNAHKTKCFWSSTTTTSRHDSLQCNWKLLAIFLVNINFQTCFQGFPLFINDKERYIT